MKTFFLLLICTLGYGHIQAQDYIYSFQGSLDAEQVSQFEKSILAVEGIKECKINLKSEIKGELFLFLETAKNQKENELEFSAATIKKVLLQYNLTPIEFIESK